MTRMCWLALVGALVAGCGSGGGAGTASDPGSGSQHEPAPTTATVVVGTQAANAQTVVYGVDFRLHLPEGVTLLTYPDSEEVQEGVLHPADGGALVGARYLPATAGSQALLQVEIADAGGFTVGALTTISCNIPQGEAVSATDFSLDGISARDASGVEMPGITLHLTVQTP